MIIKHQKISLFTLIVLSNTPIMGAAENSSEHMLVTAVTHNKLHQARSLLRRGAHVPIREEETFGPVSTKEGDTLLHVAAQRDNGPMIALLGNRQGFYSCYWDKNLFLRYTTL